MGIPSLNDGCIERANLDGKNRTIIVPQGGIFTPKQLYLDKKSGKLYWSDREGMRVMRSNLDGSNIEILVQTGQGDSDRLDATKWCIGITVDVERRQMYWTQPRGLTVCEYCMGSLAACLVQTIIAHATSRGIQIDGINIDVEGDVDLRGFTGISSDVRPGA